ncbi:hypothetical protein G647_08258 [Cladophialophora carrionii CBS 160.54]|uniref:Uncharacterized protein n=1 Tax=Cladophialophora carrionii CBS 160.54 TaxID=1279043 RepID=V9CZZ0_9EURO|nr:uncharacterized protein G647_08258 [Cladophialophora carrionii CBS 160.54]ETI20224.1 hypothetical protein G647_08258 [Cladophialophora carrionii CBS 160.54]
MIPIIPAQDLEAYPSFATTWAHVTAELLETDGSSRRANEGRARARSWEGSVRGWHDFVPGREGGDGDGHRDRDRDRDGRREYGQQEEQAGEGDGSGETPSHAVHGGEENSSSPAGLEELFRAERVRRMKDGILREILSEVPYLDEDEGVVEGSRSSERSSRITVSIPLGTRLEEHQGIRNTDAGDEAVEHPSVAPYGQSKGGLPPRLPPRLRDLVLIISASVDGAGLDGQSGAAGQEEDLLSEDINLFRANILHIAEVVSLRVIAVESSLTAFADLALEREVDSRMGLSSLSSSLQVQVEKLNALRTNALPSSLARLASTLHSLRTLQRTLLHLQLTFLEKSKHGVLSRYNAARIVFLSTVAQTMALKTQVLVLEARREVVTSPETKQKMDLARARYQQMETEEREMDERIKTLEEVVGEYEGLDTGGRGAAGGEIMAKLGRRYGEIEAELETVKRDIEMLERGKGLK